MWHRETNGFGFTIDSRSGRVKEPEARTSAIPRTTLKLNPNPVAIPADVTLTASGRGGMIPRDFILMRGLPFRLCGCPGLAREGG